MIILIIGDMSRAAVAVADHLAHLHQQPLQVVALGDDRPTPPAALDFTELVQRIKDFPELPYTDYREYFVEVRQGIEDCVAQLAQRVRQILNFRNFQPQIRRQLFQPCWSARRWKSLT